VKRDDKTQMIFKKTLVAEMPFIPDSEIVFVSSKNKAGINKIFPIIDDLYEKLHRQFKTSVLNDVLMQSTSSKVHPSSHGRPIRFKYTTQVASNPPTFLIFVNNQSLVHFSYERYLQNYFKKALALEGIKIKLIFRDEREEK